MSSEQTKPGPVVDSHSVQDSDAGTHSQADAEPSAKSNAATTARNKDRPPFILLTAIMNSSARPALTTQSHGDAMERALVAIGDHRIDGLDLVELPLAPQPFEALRKYFAQPETTVAVYDVFCVPAGLKSDVRRIAGQYKAAEILWALQAEGSLTDVPFSLNFSLPKGWSRIPKQLHGELEKAGALGLSSTASQTLTAIKSRWSAT